MRIVWCCTSFCRIQLVCDFWSSFQYWLRVLAAPICTGLTLQKVLSLLFELISECILVLYLWADKLWTWLKLADGFFLRMFLLAWHIRQFRYSAKRGNIQCTHSYITDLKRWCFPCPYPLLISRCPVSNHSSPTIWLNVPHSVAGFQFTDQDCWTSTHTSSFFEHLLRFLFSRAGKCTFLLGKRLAPLNS